MTVPQHVLLLGSSVRVVVTVARCLSEHGLTVHVASLLPDEPPIRSRAIASFCYLPTEPDAFLRELLKLKDALQIDLTYPCGDEALDLIGKSDAAQAGNIRIAAPPASVFRKVLDKGSTLEIAENIGIPIPKEYHINDPSMLLEHADTLQFPVIAKARRKDSSSVARILYFNSVEEVAEELRRNPRFVEAVVIQEYVPGNGLGVEVLMHQGEPIVLFQHRRLSELPIGGGVSVRARSELVDRTLGGYAVRLLQAIRWEGVAMVEFRHDTRSGRAVLMEVNGRYWGSLPLSYFSGLEFPWYEWQISQGIRPTPPAAYRLTTMRWTAGEIERTTQVIGEVVRKRISLGTGLREVLRFFTGFLTARDAVWRWNDRSPSWIELRTVWKKVFQPQLRRALDKLLPMSSRLREDRRTFGSAKAGRLHQELTNSLITAQSPRPELVDKRVLVLCHGNIIRSAFVEHRLRQLLPSSQIASAGMACIPGRPADPRGIAAARAYNIDLGSHRAKPVTGTMIEESEIILIMDNRNMAMLLTAWPQAALKTHAMAEWTEGKKEIDDPYDGDARSLMACFETLDEICRRIAYRKV